MIVDGRTVAPGARLEGDVCIIGSGTAGLTVARSLAATSRARIILLESGGLDFSTSLKTLPRIAKRHLRGEQSLAAGKNVGHPYYPLRLTRVRAFGGTERALRPNHGLQARPLDAVDFMQRAGVANSGWPISRHDLEPHYQRAQELCELGPYDYTAGRWETPERPALPLTGDSVETTVFQYRRHYDHTIALSELDHRPNVDIVLHASVTDLRSSESPSSLEEVTVRTLTGNTFAVAARVFVVAAGALETARLLLSSTSGFPAGIGNMHGLVGRFFMERIDLSLGYLVPANPDLVDQIGLYRPHESAGTHIKAMLRLTDDTLSREGLLNAVIRMAPMSLRAAVSNGARSGRTIRRSIHHGVPITEPGRQLAAVAREIPPAVRRRVGSSEGGAMVLALDTQAEQAPARESRIVLGDKRDALGLRQTQLDWRISDGDLASLEQTTAILDAAVRRSGLGHVESTLGPEWGRPAIFGNWHHLGTTRMHADPRKGVVDPNCRVHGTDNLYVAGGSVFTTGGVSNPVLTIVALSLRLADHLKSVVEARPEVASVDVDDSATDGNDDA